MSEQPAEYHAATPPLLRPLNPQEHREMKQLNDALTQAKISLGDRHAELRMMRVGVEELTKRALKAEARVKEQQSELAEQEVAKMQLIQETHNWSAAVKKLEAERLAPPTAGHKARNKARAILTGADPSPANAALIQSAK